jgi:hypothetical protein
LSAVFENYQQSAAVIPLDGRGRSPTTPAAPRSALDSEAYQKRFRTLQDWWTETRQHHAYNRSEQARDADFYDGLQWSDDDVLALADRGQAALVFNVTAQHINWLLGTERRTRVDFRVFSRTGQDEKQATLKTACLKYVSDVNKAQFHRSAAFADAVKVGVGWLEDGVRADTFDEPIYSRRESWRNMWWDALAVEPDLSDARYLFRVRWVDNDIAAAMFPDRAQQVRDSARTDDLLNFEDDSEQIGYSGLYYGQPQTDRMILAAGRSFMDSSFNIGNRRLRNKLVECWYRVPTRVKVIRPNLAPIYNQQTLDDLASLSGVEFNPANPDMKTLVDDGLMSVYDGIKMKVRCAVWSGSYLLQDVESPYRHDRFPFTPVWAYRRDRDNLPYGAVRNMRDPQEDLNKRRSKALFLLSTNLLIADDDAFEDWDEAVDEVSRPDGVLKKRRGAEVEIQRNLELAIEHVNLMEQDMKFLQASSGVTEENRGEVTNTNSGTAIDMRQRQGGVVTAVLFDNLRHSIQLQGEIDLALVEQFMAEPKILRLTDGRGSPSYTRINYPTVQPDGTFDVENPIQSTAATFVVDAQAFRETQRAAMFEQSMTAISTLDKTVQVQLLDLAYELSDVPNKDEWVRRLRRLNKQPSPDDPNRDAAEAAMDAADQENAALQKRAMQAEIRQKEAVAGKADASSGTARSDTMSKAVEIMSALVANPALAQAVDLLVASFNQPTGGLSNGQEGQGQGQEGLLEATVPAAVSAGATASSAPSPKPKEPTPGSASARAQNFAAP